MNRAAYEKWWHEVGSGIRPLENHDHEEHAHRVCYLAFAAGVRFARKTEQENS